MSQFVTAFDDIVIKRFNSDRVIEDRIDVRYVYAPKQRVLYDIINTAQNMSLPAVAVNISSIARDNNRVFNKLEGFYYNSGSNKKSGHLRSPVPININVSVSIITRFQTDMDQILSNFVPYTNPYIVLSWRVPNEMGLPTEQEIRSEVIWDGTMAMTYPVDLNGQTKARIIADTSFTIKGWLFKEQAQAVSNIYYIQTNFSAESILTDYDELQDTYLFPISSGLYTETETIEISASPTVTNLYFNSTLIDENLYLNDYQTGNVILYGTRFDLLDGVLLSSNNPTLFNSITSINIQNKQPETLSGYVLSAFTVINENVLTFELPQLSPTQRDVESKLTIVPYNKAGAANTSQTYNPGDVSIDTYFIYASS